MCFDYGRCDRKLLYAACKDWTGMGGTKFPLKHRAFAKRLRSRGVGDGGKAGKQRFWSKIALRDASFDREAPARASLAAQLQRARRTGNTGLP